MHTASNEFTPINQNKNEMKKMKEVDKTEKYSKKYFRWEGDPEKID